MKFLRAVLGYAIVGMIVMSVWGEFAGEWGIIGGWLAAFAIIAPMWFLNHFLGLIHHDADSGFVDMGLGVGLVGLFRDTFGPGGMDAFMKAMPTLGLVLVGSVIGGIVAAKVEEHMEGGN